jgi:phage terminase large subunit-like protein
MIEKKSKLTKSEDREYNLLINKLKKKAQENLKSPKETLVQKKKRMEFYPVRPDLFVNHYFEDDVSQGLANGMKEIIPMKDFHLEVFTQLSKKGRLRMCLEWSRSLSKTTITSLFALTWLLTACRINTDRHPEQAGDKHHRFQPHYILIVGNKISDARKRLIKIRAHLERNDKLINDFGNFKVDGAIWSADMLELINQNCLIQACSINESVRGSNYNGHRPDLIIMDDLSDNELVMNAGRADDQWDSIKSNILQTIDASKDYKYVYVENNYNPNNLIGKYRRDYIEDYIKNGGDKKNTYLSHVNMLTPQGKSCWPERFSLSDIKELQSDYFTFLREYQQEYIVKGRFFKPEMIQHIEPLPLTDYTKIVAYYDPSISSKGDFKSVSVVGITSTNQFHILDIFCKRTTMDAVVDYLFEIFDIYPSISIYIEDLFSQSTHHFMYIRDKQLARNIYLPLIKDKESKINKELRIESILPYFIDGVVYFSTLIKDKTDYQEGINQLFNFDINGSSKHDDFPDSLESALKKLNKYRKINGEYNTPRFYGKTNQLSLY